MSRSKSAERRYTDSRERANQQSSGFTSTYLKLPEGVQLFKPKTGVMLLDILPFEAGKGNPYADEGAMHWERTFYTHRGIGAGGDSYICPRMTSKRSCPICEHRMKLMKEQDEDKEELIREMGPKQRQLFNVINLREPDKGVQLWDISYFLFGKTLDATLRNLDEDDDDFKKFFFLEDGYALKIAFGEKSFAGTTFHEVERIDFKERKEQYDEEILEKVHVLDDLISELESSKLKKILLETAEKDEDEEEEEEAPKKKSSKPSKSKEDNEDEEEPDEEDEEEEEKPKMRARPVKEEPVEEPVEEDDEEEEPEDEEDDEEDSKKSSKKSSKESDKQSSKSKSSSKKDEEDDWDDFEADAEEEEEAPKKKKK